MPEMMRILVFTSLYPNNIWPHHGVFVKERVTHFAKLDGCRVKVVAPIPYFPRVKLGWRWRYSKVARQEIREGLEVCHPRYFITPKVGMSFYGLEMFLSVLRTIKEIRRDFNFDIIDAHYIYPDGLAAVLLGQYFKKPVVVSARGSDVHLYSELPMIRRLLKYTLHRADKVIAVCQALKEALIRLEVPPKKIFVIPNGVDIGKFFPMPREEARRRLGFPDKRVILSVGHLTPNKGFDLLMKAFQILYKELHREDIFLVIVGDGKIRKELESMISSLDLNGDVRLAGDIPHGELYQWYNAADIFCLASRREGWPNVLLESLACGTPVVATDVWGIPEIISSEKIGLLTRRNEQDIGRNISIALKKEWDRGEIIQYAREHTWNKVTQSVYEVFRTALNNRPLIC